MRISVDLDNTLICNDHRIPAERMIIPVLQRSFFPEPLRLGTKTLFRTLQQQGHELGIYTTSLRSSVAIKWWLRLYGISVSFVINQSRHDTMTKEHPERNFPSKYPPAFGIDLHIDDSEGVWEEGQRYGFHVICISPQDTQWVQTVLLALVHLPQSKQ